MARCFCPCHTYPGTYPPPCGYCGHDTRQGTFPGTVRDGWEPSPDSMVDTCECGDYRRDHANGMGHCKLCRNLGQPLIRHEYYTPCSRSRDGALANYEQDQREEHDHE